MPILEHNGVEIALFYEDERYPTLVVDAYNGKVGYSLNLDTGLLTRVCLCSAHSANECVCGAWDADTM